MKQIRIKTKISRNLFHSIHLYKQAKKIDLLFGNFSTHKSPNVVKLNEKKIKKHLILINLFIE